MTPNGDGSDPVDTVLGELEKFIAPLDRLTEAPERWPADDTPTPRSRMEEMGLHLLPPAQKQLVEDELSDVYETATGIITEARTSGMSAGSGLDAVFQTADTISGVVETVRELRSLGVEAPDGGDIADRVIDHLVLEYLFNHQVPVYFALYLLGAIDTKRDPDDLDLRAIKEVL